MLDNFKAIEIESPVDKIIKQIRNSIVSGQLKPGDRLPSERKLSESFNIGRTYVREAIKKLESCGIFRTMPQSGTVVTKVDVSAMDDLVSNVIRLNENDFFHLVETRLLIETYACSQAALRRSSEDILQMEKALNDYKQRVDSELPGLEQDFNFHLKIAEASQNMVIKSLMHILIPDILKIYTKINVCGEGRSKTAYLEHKMILDCIIKQDSQAAAEAMRSHLKGVIDFSLSYREEHL